MKEGKYLKLADIGAYVVSYQLSNKIWNIVLQWKNFERNTIGNQLVRSIDSISANIAEGFGRYHKKDKIKFYRYSQGSLMESMDWIQKCKKRFLISEEEYEKIFIEFKKIPKEINYLIMYTNTKLKF